MKKVFIIILLLGTSIFEGCSPNPSERVKSPQELQAELKMQEQANPDQYFNIESSMGENIVKTREAGLFRKAEYSPDGYNITGTITSTASIAKFKDAVLTAEFYSQTGTLLHQEDHMFYEFFTPNSAKNFTIHVYPPKETQQFAVKLKSITPVD